MAAIYLNGAVADGTVTRYRGVQKGSASGDVAAITAATNIVLGFLQDGPADNEEAEVVAFGECFAEAGAAFNKNVPLATDAGGRVVEFTGAASTMRVGISQEAASGAGHRVTIIAACLAAAV